jgi:hypothetical protein
MTAVEAPPVTRVYVDEVTGLLVTRGHLAVEFEVSEKAVQWLFFGDGTVLAPAYNLHYEAWRIVVKKRGTCRIVVIHAAYLIDRSDVAELHGELQSVTFEAPGVSVR